MGVSTRKPLVSAGFVFSFLFSSSDAGAAHTSSCCATLVGSCVFEHIRPNLHVSLNLHLNLVSRPTSQLSLLISRT